MRSQWCAVSLARRPWRVDQHWWRDSVSRIYYRVLVEDRQPLTIYRDLFRDKWFRQEYQ